MVGSWKKSIFAVAIVSLFAISVLGCGSIGSTGNDEFANTKLVLATTTSTSDTGLLNVLLPAFRERTGIEVKVISVGTGQAMEIGKNGDADVILVHARSAEEQFVADGYGVNRRDVMYNDFVVLGPTSDPAGIKGIRIEEAFAKIAENNSAFISRGDHSGTHAKEMKIWESISTVPSGKWYYNIGKGMGETIIMTNELLGYTLADRGTFIKMEKNIDLEVMIEGEEHLINPYGIISVSPDLHQHVNFEGAEALAKFVTSEEGRDIINGFTLEGKQLFFVNN